MARLVDPHVDFMLVGDSLAMVEHGMAATLGASLDLMIAHGCAVMAGSSRALVVVDMPFASYEASPAEAFRAAARIMAETGCGAVKLEGGTHMAETIAFLTARGIPVMAHVGLTPQAVNALGGFRSQGHDEAARATIARDAQVVAEAGAFAVVLEGIVEPLAEAITADVAVPTIGIGASAACDGQILVLEDMLGLTERVPRFVKRYGAIGEAVTSAVGGLCARRCASAAFPGRTTSTSRAADAPPAALPPTRLAYSSSGSTKGIPTKASSPRPIAAIASTMLPPRSSRSSASATSRRLGVADGARRRSSCARSCSSSSGVDRQRHDVGGGRRTADPGPAVDRQRFLGGPSAGRMREAGRDARSSARSAPPSARRCR